MDNIISVIIGFLVTMGVTQFIKNYTGLYGFGATILALAVSFLIGMVTVVAQLVMSGNFTVEQVAVNAASIFTASTIAYRALQAAFSEN